jgi:hypothetical protein
MGVFPDDVVAFIERHFDSRDWPAVYILLEADVIRTPRVMRSVLFLSNGSLSMLEHYITVCRLDVREVITRAEYVLGVSKEPMLLRSMTEPFQEEDIGAPVFTTGRFGSMSSKQPSVTSGQPDGPVDVSGDLPVKAGPKRVATPPGPHHRHIINRSFKLGNATYLIASSQPRALQVNCHRRQDNVLGLVRLPLVFVLEQLAEAVEMDVPV